MGSEPYCPNGPEYDRLKKAQLFMEVGVGHERDL